MRPVSQPFILMPTAILATVLFGCTERTDLAPVRTGYQQLNEPFPPAPSAPTATKSQAAAPRRPALTPASAKRYPAPANAFAQPGKRQPPAASAVRPGIGNRSGKDENKAKPGIMVSASAPPGKVTPEAGSGKPVRKQPAAGKSPSAPAAGNDNTQLNFDWPLAGAILKNYAQTGKKGIRIAGKKGQTVRAAESGKVVYSGQGLIGYGNLLIIKHNDQYLTAYANNNALLAKEGDIVKKGQEIATVGVGASRKAMLHFEIRKQGKSVNPITLLPKL